MLSYASYSCRASAREDDNDNNDNDDDDNDTAAKLAAAMLRAGFFRT